MRHSENDYKLKRIILDFSIKNTLFLIFSRRIYVKKLFIFLALCITCNVWSQSWSPPVDLDSPPSSYVAEGVFPQIEVDAAGNAFAAWCSTNGGNAVFAARYDALAQSWGPTVQIGIGNAENAILSVTSDGKAIVVWDRDSVIYYNSYVGGWRGEGAVDPLGGPSQIHARVGVNGNDRAIAVWATPAGPTGDTIRGGVYDFAANSWSNVDITSTSPDFFVGQPEIAVSVSNSTRAIAVWRYRDEVTNDFRIQYSVYTNAWSPVESIATSEANQLVIPIVAISNDGSTAIANWAQTNLVFPFIDYYVMGSVYTGSWSAPIQLSPDQGHLTLSGGLGPEKGLPFYSIAFDESGDAVDVWSFVDESLVTPEYIIQARTFQSSAFSPAQNISGTNDFLPQIALDGSGNGWAVWNQGSFFAPPINILATPFTKSGNTWGISEIISTSTFSALANVATNALGNFFADWVNFEAGGIIQASSLIESPLPPTPSPVLPLPPTNFNGKIRKNKFINETQYILKARWDASPSANVISYRIYKKGQVVEKVSANSPLVFVASFDSKKTSFKYKIVSVNSNNQESASIKLRIGKD